jgi:hypothetical protein
MSSPQFRYFADPLSLTGVVLYAAHKLLIKPTTWGSHGLLHDYLNDFLLIPIFLPPTLWVLRRLGVRTHDGPPSGIEIVSLLAMWAALFLWVFPEFRWMFRHSTRDPYNAVAYTVGAAVAGLVWNWNPHHLPTSSGEPGSSVSQRKPHLCAAGPTLLRTPRPKLIQEALEVIRVQHRRRR